MSLEVPVGPFRVRDATCEQLLTDLVKLAEQAQARPVTVFALHVGGLNCRRDPEFVSAMSSADVVYADGGAVVWLARLAGGTRVERAPTTDFGWDILDATAEQLGRPPRVALIGGQDGLADRAGAALQRAGAADVVAVEHGYHSDWAAPLERVRSASPDITLVGMGAPREMLWATEHYDRLPAGLLLTCGGWFGFLAGEEHRAPRPLRRSGLEWLARVAQAPKRLAPRYGVGIISTAVMAWAIIAQRLKSSTCRSPDGRR